MFKDISNKFPPYDLKDVSEERANADSAAVFALIEKEENNMKQTSDQHISINSSDFINEYGDSAQPQVIYPQKHSLLKSLIPIAAAAAAIAVMVPVGVNIIKARSSGEDLSSVAAYESGQISGEPYSGNTESGAGNYSGVSPASQSGAASAGSPNANAPVGKPAESVPYITDPSAVIDTPAAAANTVKYIKGYEENAVYPDTRIITNVEELKALFPGERADLSAYSGEFFKDNSLILIREEESSGSNKLNVKEVRIQETYPATVDVYIERDVPEVGTCDMAYWHILIPVDKSIDNESAKISVHSVLPDGENIPSLAELCAMSDEQRADAIDGRTAAELIAAWGEPNEQLSGFYGFIWHYDGKEMVVYFDENHCVNGYMFDSLTNWVQHTEPNHAVPLPLADIAGMSYEEVKEALKGFTLDDLVEAWGGEPYSYYDADSYEKGVVWYFGETKHILILSDGDRITDIKLYDTRN